MISTKKKKKKKEKPSPQQPDQPTKPRRRPTKLVFVERPLDFGTDTTPSPQTTNTLALQHLYTKNRYDLLSIESNTSSILPSNSSISSLVTNPNTMHTSNNETETPPVQGPNNTPTSQYGTPYNDLFDTSKQLFPTTTTNSQISLITTTVSSATLITTTTLTYTQGTIVHSTPNISPIIPTTTIIAPIANIPTTTIPENPTPFISEYATNYRLITPNNTKPQTTLVSNQQSWNEICLDTVVEGPSRSSPSPFLQQPSSAPSQQQPPPSFYPTVIVEQGKRKRNNSSLSISSDE